MSHRGSSKLGREGRKKKRRKTFSAFFSRSPQCTFRRIFRTLILFQAVGNIQKRCRVCVVAGRVAPPAPPPPRLPPHLPLGRNVFLRFLFFFFDLPSPVCWSLVFPGKRNRVWFLGVKGKKATFELFFFFLDN